MAEQITNYQCPACLGPLQYSAASGKLECEYCGGSYEVAEVEAFYEVEQAEPAAPLTFKERIVNFWYYYKWHTIIIAFIALLLHIPVRIKVYAKYENREFTNDYIVKYGFITIKKRKLKEKKDAVQKEEKADIFKSACLPTLREYIFCLL